MCRESREWLHGTIYICLSAYLNYSGAVDLFTDAVGRFRRFEPHLWRRNRLLLDGDLDATLSLRGVESEATRGRTHAHLCTRSCIIKYSGTTIAVARERSSKWGCTPKGPTVTPPILFIVALGPFGEYRPHPCRCVLDAKVYIPFGFGSRLCSLRPRKWRTEAVKTAHDL